MLIGADDVAARGRHRRRHGLGRRLPQRLPAATVAAVPRRRRRRPRHGRCRSTGRCTRCCAGTPRRSSSRPSSCRMDIVGRYGGPCRPPRAAAAARAGGAPSAPPPRRPLAAGLALRPMRTPRVFHAVDSHTEGMPTRVITGGVGVIPGATMAERRQLLHRATRRPAHAADVRAARPRRDERRDPAAADPARTPTAGVLYIEVSGCLPMCGHGTIGVATVLVETGMVRGRPSRSPRSGSTPRPGSSSSRSPSRTARRRR